MKYKMPSKTLFFKCICGSSAVFLNFNAFSSLFTYFDIHVLALLEQHGDQTEGRMFKGGVQNYFRLFNCIYNIHILSNVELKHYKIYRSSHWFVEAGILLCHLENGGQNYHSASQMPLF